MIVEYMWLFRLEEFGIVLDVLVFNEGDIF